MSGVPASSSVSSASSEPDVQPPQLPGGRIHRKTSMGGVYEDVELFAETKFPVPVWSVSVSHSGILCGLDDGTIVLLRNDLVESHRTEHAHHKSAVTQLQWAPDSLHFLSCGMDAYVKVWRVDGDQLKCMHALKQPASLIAASFHPNWGVDPVLGGGEDTLFVLTGDKRISGWVNGQLELYEALPPKDTPVSMAVSSQLSDSGACLIAIGTKKGDLLLYEHSADGITFLSSIACRNRRGPFSDGTPIVAISFVTESDLLVSSQDNRIRLVHIAKSVSKGGGGTNSPKKTASGASYTSKGSTGANVSFALSIMQKFRGQKSSSGESPFGAFVLSPPAGPPVLQVGSECGRIFAWSLPEFAGGQFAQRKRSLLKRIARKLKPSRALKSSESWTAVSYPDKLTAVAPAPWGACTVAASLEGYVKIFLGKFGKAEKN